MFYLSYLNTSVLRLCQTCRSLRSVYAIRAVEDVSLVAFLSETELSSLSVAFISKDLMHLFGETKRTKIIRKVLTSSAYNISIVKLARPIGLFTFMRNGPISRLKIL